MAGSREKGGKQYAVMFDATSPIAGETYFHLGRVRAIFEFESVISSKQYY